MLNSLLLYHSRLSQSIVAGSERNYLTHQPGISFSDRLRALFVCQIVITSNHFAINLTVSKAFTRANSVYTEDPLVKLKPLMHYAVY